MAANPLLSGMMMADASVLDSTVRLALGIAAIAALGWLAANWLRRSAWQRAVWQMVLLAMLGLAAAEIAGLSSCLLHMASTNRMTAVESVDFIDVQRTIGAASSPPRSAFLPPQPDRSDTGSFEDALAAPQGLDVEALPSPLTEQQERTTVLLAVRSADADSPAAAEQDSSVPEEEAEAAGEPFAADSDQDESIAAGPVSRSWREHLARSLALVWLAGAAVLGLRSLVGSALLLRFSRRLRPVRDDALTWSMHLVARRLGLRRPVRLCEAAGLTAPMAWGTMRPMVALPPGFAEDYRAEEQQAMLAHELAHLRGIDPLWQRLADWLAAILWWHPAVWWSRRQWRAASETAADEASLVVAGGPELLAECLVQLGGRVSGARPLGWVGIQGAFRSHLGRRVERLLKLGNQQWRPPRRRWLWAKALVPAAAVLTAIVCTSWARSETPYRGEADMNMVRHYWRQSLLGVALMATLQSANPASADEAAPVQDTLAVAPDQESPSDAPREGARKEGLRRDGDRPRGEGDRPRDGDRPREGDRPRDDDPPRATNVKRDPDRPRGEGERRDGDRPKEGDRPRDTDRPRGEKERPDRVKTLGELPRSAAGDEDRQLRHLIAAAENLDAAGLRDEAARIRVQIAERMAKRGGDRPRDPGTRPGERVSDRLTPSRDTDAKRPTEARGSGTSTELMQVIRQLQAEVAQLRREVSEMRRMMPRGGGGEGGRPIRPEGPRERPDPDRRPETRPDRPDNRRDDPQPKRE